MEEKILLEVSKRQDCFHFNTDIDGTPGNADWIPVGVTTWGTAYKFCRYIYGEFNNHLPDIETVKEKWKSYNEMVTIERQWIRKNS